MGMKVVVLTSKTRGLVVRCLPVLGSSPQIEVAAVILARHSAPARRRLARKLRKAWRIGIAGAVNGVRIRSWFADDGTPQLHEVCEAHDVPLWQTDLINSQEAVEFLDRTGADLGVSIGNSYIAPRVFTIPKFGMINVHSEILPKYRGAQSVIWPVFDGATETGFTIHQINNLIDGGEILHQERLPIQFRHSLRETVVTNLAVVHRQVPDAFRYVCENYPRLKAAAQSQPAAPGYSTPTLSQFLRMVRNNKRLHQIAQPSVAPAKPARLAS
jgi:methionyl-tRNA formyltransferase